MSHGQPSERNPLANQCLPRRNARGRNRDATHDKDCTAAGTRLLAMRKDLAVMIEEFTALGGAVPLPTVDERLKENYRPISKSRIVNLPPPTKGKVLGGRSW
jgi:hypothetical protein